MAATPCGKTAEQAQSSPCNHVIERDDRLEFDRKDRSFSEEGASYIGCTEIHIESTS
jgi:hypothetical protein